jgi:hypothetical protein
MEIINTYLKYVGEERGWWDNEIIEVTTEGNKDSQIQEFSSKVRNFYNKEIEESFHKAYAFWQGVSFEQPFSNLIIYNIDLIFEATERIHDILQTKAQRTDLKINYDFLVLGKVGNDLITYNFKSYNLISEQDFYDLVFDSPIALGNTYEKMLEEILNFYVEDLEFDEEI